MDKIQLLQLAQQYLAREEHAWEEVHSTLKNNLETGWAIVLELINQSDTEEDLMYIAAGPLEDIICEHSEAIIARVVERVKQDKRFKECLRGVWGANAMPKDIRQQIDRTLVR